MLLYKVLFFPSFKSNEGFTNNGQSIVDINVYLIQQTLHNQTKSKTYTGTTIG